MQEEIQAFLEYLEVERMFSGNTIAAYRNDLGQFHSFLQALGPADRMALLSGRSPVPMPSIGRVVCSCFNVGVNQIAAAVAGGCTSVDQVGAQLRAGTNCGSCRSEIRTIIDAGRLQAAE